MPDRDNACTARPPYVIMKAERQVNPMICPECRAEMQEGYLISNRALYFSLEEDGSALEETSFNVGEGGGIHRFVFGSRLPTHYCPECQLLLARRPTKVSDLDRMKTSVRRTIKKLKKEDF